MPKIASWNVNSVRVRATQVVAWLTEYNIDVACLQETKCIDADFPESLFLEQGYYCQYSGEKTYNGTAIISRRPCTEVNIPEIPAILAKEKRIMAASFEHLRLINVYVPNGAQIGTPKFEYKLEWLRALRTFLQAEIAAYPDLLIMGDFNIAPQPEDVHDPDYWSERILFTPPEREALESLLSLGLEDIFRWQPQPAESFSWWDFRTQGFRRNAGLRIDLILATPSLKHRLQDARIHKACREHERPSDHAPVCIDLL